MDNEPDIEMYRFLVQQIADLAFCEPEGDAIEVAQKRVLDMGKIRNLLRKYGYGD